MWKGNDKAITVKQFYLIIRMVEAEAILKISDFRNLEKIRPEIMKDILDSLLRQKDFDLKPAKQIAGYYLNDFPMLKSIQTYDKQDLALALANVYHPSLLALDILHITEMTGYEAVAVASALLSEFDPASKRVDGSEPLGEFIKYRDKPSLFFNAIETRRAYQYQTLFGIPFADTPRYKALGLDKPPVIIPQAVVDLESKELEHSHDESEIELETVEYDALEQDDWGNGDENEENDESYLEDIQQDTGEDYSDFEDADYDDLRDVV